MSYETTKAYNEHVSELIRRADGGDVFALKTVSALALLGTGWRPGDPDPSDGPDGDGGEPLPEIRKHQLRLVA